MTTVTGLFPERKEIVHYRFEHGDGFSFRGLDYSYHGEEEGSGYLLQRVDNQIVVGFTYEQMTANFEATRDAMEHFRGKYSGTKRQPSWNKASLLNINPKQKRKLIFKLDLLKELTALLLKGDVKRNDDDFDRVLPGLFRKLANPQPWIKGKRLTYNGKRKMTKEVWEPAGSTVRKWLTAFERSGDPFVLLDNYGGNGGRTFLQPEVEALVTECVGKFANREVPFATDAFKDLDDQIKEINLRRSDSSQLERPCIETLRARIRKLPPALLALRRGPGAAELAHSVDRGGTERLRPLERLEQDEWIVDTHVLLAIVGLQDKLTPEELRRIPRVTLWLTALIDVATKTIVSADVHLADPSTTTSIAALAMATRDKSDLARELGCSAAWPYHGTPEEVGTDSAAWFSSDEFRWTLLLLGANLYYPPTGAASARGTIERFFRTMSTKALEFFSGRTWGSSDRYTAKEAEKEASVVLALARESILRFIVDVYHHTPHDGGETPHAAWVRLTKRYGVIPSPTGLHRRAIFGLREEATIRAEGVTWRGVPFQSNALQHVRRNRTRKITLSINLENLGQSTFFDGRDFYPLPAKYQDFEGMSALEWFTIRDAFKANAEVQAEVSREMVSRARADLRASGRLARLKAGLPEPVITPEAYEKFEKGMRRKYAVTQRGHDFAVNVADWRPSAEYMALLGFEDIALPADIFDADSAQPKLLPQVQPEPEPEIVHDAEFDSD
ncbi:Integrase, catalytic domain [Neorhizobium galegae bv. orientalis]|nr:Integrase, catalytic domain [Neorhizobium galegae bv. orientalis]